MSNMMPILFPFFILFSVSIPAQEVGEPRPEAKDRKAVDAPKLGENIRQTFQVRFLRASDVLSIAQRVIGITSLKVDVDHGGGAGRKAPKEKIGPQSESIGNTLLVADGVANTLIVHGPPKHVEVIRNLIAAIDVDLAMKDKKLKYDPNREFKKP